VCWVVCLAGGDGVQGEIVKNGDVSRDVAKSGLSGAGTLTPTSKIYIINKEDETMTFDMPSAKPENSNVRLHVVCACACALLCT